MSLKTKLQKGARSRRKKSPNSRSPLRDSQQRPPKPVLDTGSSPSVPKSQSSARPARKPAARPSSGTRSARVPARSTAKPTGRGKPAVGRSPRSKAPGRKADSSTKKPVSKKGSTKPMPLSNAVADKEVGGSFAINGPFEFAYVFTTTHDFGGAKSKGPFPALVIVGFKSADQPINQPDILVLSCGDINKVRPYLHDFATGQGHYVEAGQYGNLFEAAPGISLKGLPEKSKAAGFIFSAEPYLGRALVAYNELNGKFATLKTVKEKTTFEGEKDPFGQAGAKEEKEIEYTYIQAIHPAPLWAPHANVPMPSLAAKAKGGGKSKTPDAATGVPPMAVPAPAVATPVSVPSMPVPAAAPVAMPSMPPMPSAPTMPMPAPMAPPPPPAPVAPPMPSAPPIVATPAAPPISQDAAAWIPWADEIAKRVLVDGKTQGQASMSWSEIQLKGFPKLQSAPELQGNTAAMKYVLELFINPAWQTAAHTGWVNQGGICSLVG